MEKLQKDLDELIKSYHNKRTNQGKICCERTLLDTLLAGQSICALKNLAQI